ncbi:hypothetical protein TVAG_042970 [Trichomonas vaginalis G3]|uniref:Uncharacterized protein n=1 Tax=Trichomonas vaginalis (strain ATCC PRA-98 / G3) TaxID=412133 RepID=A2F6R1_TRIV3|nr:hypothetical protein TVAGG3_0701630 [Trichomonas vaginalis G3]EAX99389.1 hypothetical protein TVAG_042970 [Trichomonas vaginalis G3]KAI5509283.1 hypothetical protein TVAGG3_0701630 [Trichomonas vaginalis G3]|eukprot:XP_001312319.1 hypothetical protein [Trichomonas vaginalis G3]
MIDTHQRIAYIKLDSFDVGNFQTDYGSRIVASVGSRSSLIRNSKEFSSSERSPQKVWEFKYNNPNTSSFILSLSKKRIFGGDIMIGEADIKVSNYELNKVVKHDVRLKNHKNKYLTSKATIFVHICEDGANPFSAETGRLIESSRV